jgi:hypothetical protein
MDLGKRNFKRRLMILKVSLGHTNCLRLLNEITSPPLPLCKPPHDPFSYLACASRSAYIADTEPLCQHYPKHTIVPIAPHFASRNAYRCAGTTHLGPAHAPQNSHARE